MTQPSISYFLPLSGNAGTMVSISGSGFHPDTTGNAVYFGAVRGNVIFASTGSIHAIVPPGATCHAIVVTNLTTGLTAFSGQRFMPTFSCGALPDSLSFGRNSDHQTGLQPLWIADCDFDGDGFTDLVTPNYTSNYVSVFRNTSQNGTINFAPGEDFITGNGPEKLTTGDLDGDGMPDVAVSNDWAHTVSVLRNISTVGNISFEDKLDIPTGKEMRAIVISDFDQDGKPDIAAAHQSLNTQLMILRNSGTPGNMAFSVVQDLSTGQWPSGMSAGDLDGDGKPDIAICSNYDSKVSILRNTSSYGNISFAAPIDYSTTNPPTGNLLVDIDLDGDPDLVVSNGNAGSISIFRNSSTPGQILLDQKRDFPVGIYPIGIATGDADGDGLPDLSVAIHGSGTVSVLRNITTGGVIDFDPPLPYEAGSQPIHTSMADLDLDGKPDLAVVNQMSDSFTVLQNLLCDTPFPTGDEKGNGHPLVYPNPFIGQATVDMEQPFTGELSVIDLNGRTILHRAVRQSRTIELNLQGVPPGIYLLRLTGNHQVFTEKLRVK
jgi:hypothetical protein